MNNYEIVFLKPEKYEDVKKTADHIRADRIVHINVSKLTEKERKRTIDYISGAAYIKDSQLKQPGENIYCKIPSGKEFLYEGEEIDLRYDEVPEIKPQFK